MVDIAPNKVLGLPYCVPPNPFMRKPHTDQHTLRTFKFPLHIPIQFTSSFCMGSFGRRKDSSTYTMEPKFLKCNLECFFGDNGSQAVMSCTRRNHETKHNFRWNVRRRDVEEADKGSDFLDFIEFTPHFGVGVNSVALVCDLISAHNFIFFG